MNNNIEKIKKELIIMFTVIVFLIMSFFGTTFFLVKYIKDISIEKKYVENILNIAEKGHITLDNIIRLQNRFDNNLNKRNKENKEVLINPMNNLIKTKGFINYLHYDSLGLLIGSNVKDDIKINLVEEIKDNKKYYNTEITSGFIVRKFNVNSNNGTFIILKKLRYNITDFISDILGYIIINILFSLVLYFIGTRFVNRAFIPVEENMLDMKNFIHNAGHELKTPIAVIDSNIQLLDDMKCYDKSMTKELQKEALKINSIIESLIKLSDIDCFKELDKNNLYSTINEILTEQKKAIKKKELKIKINVPYNIVIKANKSYFYIFLSNLIGNAIKYNKAKGEIHIKYIGSKLFIEDNGIGIDKKSIDKIFDRFYKADKSRNSEGFGIGLSLVKKIADIYKWNIKVKSEIGKSTTFIINF